ncbi:hypothetical protein [Janibacter alittae]|uniref:Uncharacterized protein n=1 Tax=Janibacter alittae TaxID=3115209 RepID=A0ABZ2MFJ1_9MICO
MGLGDDTLAEGPYDTPFGSTTVGGAFDRFYGFDLLVHRWDIGRTAGIDVVFSDRELDQIEEAIAGFGEAIRGEGVCAPAVDLPADASRQEPSHRPHRPRLPLTRLAPACLRPCSRWWGARAVCWVGRGV